MILKSIILRLLNLEVRMLSWHTNDFTRIYFKDKLQYTKKYQIPGNTPGFSLIKSFYLFHAVTLFVVSSTYCLYIFSLINHEVFRVIFFIMGYLTLDYWFSDNLLIFASIFITAINLVRLSNMVYVWSLDDRYLIIKSCRHLHICHGMLYDKTQRTFPSFSETLLVNSQN